jgi:hypothetical protein
LPKGNRGLRSRAVKGGFKNFLAPQAARNEVERVKKTAGNGPRRENRVIGKANTSTAD